MYHLLRFGDLCLYRRISWMKEESGELWRWRGSWTKIASIHFRVCVFDGQVFDSWERNGAGYKAQRYFWKSAVVTRDFGEIQSNPFSAKLIREVQRISGNFVISSQLIKSMRLWVLSSISYDELCFFSLWFKVIFDLYIHSLFE